MERDIGCEGAFVLRGLGTEECKLESDCSELTSGVNTSTSASVGVLGTKKRSILFRPKPLKFLPQKTCSGPTSAASFWPTTLPQLQTSSFTILQGQGSSSPSETYIKDLLKSTRLNWLRVKTRRSRC